MWHSVGLTLLVFVATLLIVLLLMVCGSDPNDNERFHYLHLIGDRDRVGFTAHVGISYGIFFYQSSSFCGNWWETQDLRREIMSLQGLKRKKMLRGLHTGSDLLGRGGPLLLKATDPDQDRVSVNEEEAHWLSLTPGGPSRFRLSAVLNLDCPTGLAEGQEERDNVAISSKERLKSCAFLDRSVTW
ncbi:hypothetical protein MC885_020968 [Smutsia gigantea]|nr:hypothetical protein MC885_020968 [Smutsia gigantea]